MGHPILYDTLYNPDYVRDDRLSGRLGCNSGTESADYLSLRLHAYKLLIRHPMNGILLNITAQTSTAASDFHSAVNSSLADNMLNEPFVTVDSKRMDMHYIETVAERLLKCPVL
jgi:hypothetical protein